MAANDANNSKGNSSWSPEDILILTMSIMKKDNPTLGVSDWDTIEDIMRPTGHSKAACKMRWMKMRKDYLEAFGGGDGSQPATPVKSPAKRKRTKAAGAANEDDGINTPSKKNRKKVVAPEKGVVADEDGFGNASVDAE